MKTIIGTFLTICGLLAAQAPQAPNPTQQLPPNENEARMAAGSAPIYRITVVGRTTKAVNYRHRGGATKIDFAGTTLLPNAHGQAKVESKQGYIEIEVEFRELQAATAYGPEFLTYVMWAITPEGRTVNLGEVLLNGTNSKLNVTTQLQSFGLIVTAEPYFAVTQPSDVVVMDNVIRPDTRGQIEEVDAKYELLKRGQYTLNVNPAEIKPVRLGRRVPLELYEARNAVQIARWTGSQQYAAETYQKAAQGLANAEGYWNGKADRKQVVTAAREAVQMAEDSRIIAIKKMEEERLANERQAGAERELRAESARAAAQAETERVAREAEAARLNAQAEADRLRQANEAQTAAAQAEADRLKRETDARVASAQAEADRLKRESEAQMAAAQSEADRLRRENEAQRAAAQADLDRLAREKAQAEAEKTELRTQLLTQFNAILQTRDTARGLIVNMSDVLFDTAKYSLRPLAREKLAKVAGIILGHPGLRLDVEGHTDSVGGDDYNQRLSEQRGSAVRDFLIRQGMPADSVSSRGFGKTQPVVSNDTAAGRQQNRRVELVVSGDIIGTRLGAPIPPK
ncbi:MAG: OmpA family protein [Bryobacteraceae bacterium]|jgi:outer membrane protein OmpA-like peptidoglycan-associated protein